MVMTDVTTALKEIRAREGLSQERLAQMLGVSFVSVNRWERGAAQPSPNQTQRIITLHRGGLEAADSQVAFASRGIRQRLDGPTLFDEPIPEVKLASQPGKPILDRITRGKYFSKTGKKAVTQILSRHPEAALTVNSPPVTGMSAGKNTYTYDAHTYHTKVPPQGIAEILRHYLPDGGLVLDPFAGSGMTGVAARANGLDCLLNELSPAACFIAQRFVSQVSPAAFKAALEVVLAELEEVRRKLFTTTCRECDRETELLYAVWSYKVGCSSCGKEFLLWDHCRKYGARVREHKILREFPCPYCHEVIRKSRLTRTVALPVQVGYMCCGSRQQEQTHSPNAADLALIAQLEQQSEAAEGYFPKTPLPDGVNLRQPKGHGIDRVDKFYSARNLAAMSHIWKTIHRLEDPELAAQMAFVFTSLYQRVTRLSEFRFWGGSGNTARFNVPYIFNESNVFKTFERKARTIQDHLESTATFYSGRVAVIQGSATSLEYLPDESVDLIFTDPPFGANINYSEMNIIWESWLGRFTDARPEAIVNKVQGKDIGDYGQLMTESLREAFRVLRAGHWMLLVFMNSSQRVWEALMGAIAGAGFEVVKADIFDKQHGTFKQFVSENTAGADLVLHCRKPMSSKNVSTRSQNGEARSFDRFLASRDIDRLQTKYLHVSRESELDYRQLYSEWTAEAVVAGGELVDFASFRKAVDEWLASHSTES
jgi:DNA modification methylase/DNA-binding XRE family transcriptional regulator